MSHAFLALEIADHGVRAFSFVREKGGRISLDQTAFRVPGEDASLESAALDVLEAVKAQKGEVQIYLPVWDFMARNLRLPFRGAGKIAQILPMEMGGGLGISPEAFEVHFLETSKKAGSTEVFALALENFRHEHLIRVLGDAGFFVPSLDVSHLAAARAVALMEGQAGGWAFVDTRGALLLMDGDRPLGVRMLPSAEQGEGPFVDAVFSALAELGTLRFPDHPPELIRLSGPLAFSLESPLAEKTGLAVKCHGPGGGKDPDPQGILVEDEGGLRGALAAFAGARGKAGLRFRERGWRWDHFFAAHGKALAVSGFFTFFVLLVLIAHVFLDIQRLKNTDQYLDAEIRRVFTTTLPGVTRIVDPLHQMRTHLGDLEKASAFAASGSGNHRMVDILKALAEGAPEGAPMNFSRLAITGDQLTLAGDTDTFNNVDGLKNRLSGHPLFSGVTITRATADQDEGRIHFNLRVDLR
ncbi:GspL-like protein [Desulfobotulus alkaliphilus]|uniref:GspL-like protein n=1 Tax=Desulfobotulus alkaliphilus TaxID=622671 RepID=A0A562SA57_9BACT|nr:GspL/Epsl periplasmic domain-containing protein [Desulfobotulus alkaliphilus]TWI77460.1 GspL-like protein [Desulfobotulus alkaliphilus]